MKQDIYDGVVVLLKAPGITRSSKQCHKKDSSQYISIN